MASRFVRLAICCAALVASAGSGTAAAKRHVVQLTDSPPYMTPLAIDAAVGDTIVFHNVGPKMVHALTDESLVLYSGDLEVGKEWSYTFKRAGVYPYVCQRHHFMRGAVTVHNPDGSTVSPPEHAYDVAFREFVIPTPQSVPRMIIPSRVDDTMWFTEGGGDFYGFENIPARNKIGHIDESGRVVEFATPTAENDGSKVGVDSLVMDDRGRIWFTERVAGRIGLLDTNGGISERLLPTANSHPLGIDIDRRKNVWFAERFANRIGYITPAGQIREIELPGKESEPRTIFVDSRQRVWYTARTANEIGYYDPKSRRIVRLLVPTQNARPTGICEAPDGSIYFVEMVGNKIGHVVGDHIIEHALPTKFSAPFKIVSDGKAALWLTEVFGNALARFDLRTSAIAEFKVPTPDSRPGGLTVDRRGRVWFTEQMGNKIGMFDPAAAERAMASPAAAKVMDYHLPSLTAGPGNDLIDDGEGRLWFNEIYGNKIGAFDMQRGSFREFSLQSESSMPVGLARDKKGNFWAAQFRTNSLARLDPRTGAVSEYRLPTDAAMPAGVAVDEEGTVWVTELGANRLAAFDAARERFSEYELPRKDSSPLHVATDGRGGVWFTASEESGNYLGRFDVRTRRFDVHELPTPRCSPIGLLIDGSSVWVTEGAAAKLARFDVTRVEWEEFPIPTAKSEPAKLGKDRFGRIWITDGGGMGGLGGNQLVVFDPARRSFQFVAMRTSGAKPRGILGAPDGSVWFTQQNANILSRMTWETH